MDKEEAKKIIEAELEPFRSKPYIELAQMISAEEIVDERPGCSGAQYYVEIEAFWDDKPGGDIRVFGTIHDGGWRAYFPLCEDFIKSPSNEFVGE